MQLAATLSPRNLLLCRPDAFTRAWPWPTYHHKPARVAGAPGDQNPVERSTREPAPFNCLPRGSRSTSRTPFLLKKGTPNVSRGSTFEGVVCRFRKWFTWGLPRPGSKKALPDADVAHLRCPGLRRKYPYESMLEDRFHQGWLTGSETGVWLEALLGKLQAVLILGGCLIGRDGQV